MVSNDLNMFSITPNMVSSGSNMLSKGVFGVSRGENQLSKGFNSVYGEDKIVIDLVKVNFQIITESFTEESSVPLILK